MRKRRREWEAKKLRKEYFDAGFKSGFEFAQLNPDNPQVVVNIAGNDGRYSLPEISRVMLDRLSPRPGNTIHMTLDHITDVVVNDPHNQEAAQEETTA